MPDLKTLVDALTTDKPQSSLVDEINHSGGAGRSRLERWPVRSGNFDTVEGPWLWRVMHRPPGRSRSIRWTRISFGISDTRSEALTESARTARRLAKERRKGDTSKPEPKPKPKDKIVRMPFLSVLYDDANPETYEGVQLQMLAKPDVFNTGDPTVDYHTAMAVIFKRCDDAGVDIDDVPIQGSSSIDHFVMDGGELHDGKPSNEIFEQSIANAKAYLGIKEQPE